ncbi:hypothetical protein [Embleya sp. NPDC020630]|uniref:hypothetical protein n=1 Tax=Embleya sp. NPDC020630 TaxID=3363979 RepID=UPI0037BD0531
MNAVLPRVCRLCGTGVCEYGSQRCWSCLHPGRPLPPCRTCGSAEHFSGGYCQRCRPRWRAADSCRYCFAWGTERHQGKCRACTSYIRKYPVGVCSVCRLEAPVDDLVCRLCRHQAGMPPRTWRPPDLRTAAVTGQQLFFSDMVRRVRLASRPRAAEASPAMTAPLRITAARWMQPRLFDSPRDMRPVMFSEAEPKEPEFARYLISRADDIADARGWSNGLRSDVRNSLYLLASVHDPSERIKASTVLSLHRPGVRRSVHRTLEILLELGLLDDDRPDRLAQWISRKLEGLAPEIRTEAEHWMDVLRRGRPRHRPRTTSMIRSQLTCATPFLKDFSQQHTTLRQATRADIVAWLDGRPSALQDADALRSLFRVLKAERVLFADPARTLRMGARPLSVPTPLTPDQVLAVARAAAADPALQMVVALVGIHALHPRDVRALPLHAVDLHNDRLVYEGIDRPLDDYTRAAANRYLAFRRERWPRTANPHFLISSQTANTTAAVTYGWTHQLFRVLPTTAARLREDRLLEEAAAVGADPLHLTALFNISPETGLRYTNALRQTTTPDTGDDH